MEEAHSKSSESESEPTASGENGDGDVLRSSPVHQLKPHSSTVDNIVNGATNNVDFCANNAEERSNWLAAQTDRNGRENKVFIFGFLGILVEGGVDAEVEVKGSMGGIEYGSGVKE
ncbi:Uncharacterized protein Fot_08514 [Forsythia ovata]|uniref:Uncharacterized protein n=1 Tax=Forsythia ovata TaxID=205694 RepID=A0ABD1WYV4_9LAMI